MIRYNIEKQENMMAEMREVSNDVSDYIINTKEEVG